MTEPRWFPPEDGKLGFRIRPASDAAAPATILLHGWSGDETSMWIFDHLLPKQGMVAAPRGLYPLSWGGFQWSADAEGWKTRMADFQPAVAALDRTLDHLQADCSLDLDRMAFVGFSQGAALAFAAAGSKYRPQALVSLAGFLPEGGAEIFSEMAIFWGHGTRDMLVPVEIARQAVRTLTQTGANVHYCETDVDHKLGIECARGLSQWLSSVFTPE